MSSPATAAKAPAKAVDVTRTVLPSEAADQVLKTFEDCCWDMGAVPAVQQIQDVKTIASWDRGLVVFGLRYIQHALSRGIDTLVAYYEALTRHELGHALTIWGVPGTFVNMVFDNQYVDKLCKKKWSREQVHDFLNIVYDTVDDTLGHLEFGADILLVQEIIDSAPPEPDEPPNPLAEPDYEPGTKKVAEWLIAFRQAATKTPFSPCICTEIQDAAYESSRIIRDCWDNRLRVQRLCDLLYPLFKEEFDKAHEEIKKLLEKLGIGTPMTAEMGDKGKIMDALAQQSEEAKKIAKELLGMMEPGVAISFDLANLWEKAGRKVNLRLTVHQESEGEELRVGDYTWVPGMPLRDLDIQATINKYGKVFLPGVTTQRAFNVPGPGRIVPSPQPHRIKGVTDVSGSMQAEPTSMALFTIIREAERRRMPVAVNTFGNNVVTHGGFTKDYFGLATKIYQDYSKAGGGNSVSGLEKSDDLRAGDLLFYITDFQLPDNDQQHAIKTIRNLKAKGVQVVFIAMFSSHDAACSGLNYMECLEIDDLYKHTLQAV